MKRIGSRYTGTCWAGWKSVWLCCKTSDVSRQRGGRCLNFRYLHINANGDVDPCVFIHYSDSNIREKSLLEALRSPMMMAYHKNQPFNENMLRPCPMLENPEMLRLMVAWTGAHSTDLQSPESADHLRAKCDQYAACWKPVADKLWAENRRDGQS